MKRPDVRCFIGDKRSAQNLLLVLRHMPSSCDISLVSDFNSYGYQLASKSRYGTIVLRGENLNTINDYVSKADLVICTMSDTDNVVESEALKYACEKKKKLIILTDNVHNMDMPGWNYINYHIGINKDNIIFIAHDFAHASTIKNRWSDAKHIYTLGNPLYDEMVAETKKWHDCRQLYRNMYNLKDETILMLMRSYKDSPEIGIAKTSSEVIDILSRIGKGVFVSNIETDDNIRDLCLERNVQYIKDGSSNLNNSLVYMCDIVISESDYGTAEILASGVARPVVIYNINETGKYWLKHDLKLESPRKLIGVEQKRALLSQNKLELEACIRKALKPMTQKNLLKSYYAFPKSAEKIAELISALAHMSQPKFSFFRRLS